MRNVVPNGEILKLYKTNKFNMNKIKTHTYIYIHLYDVHIYRVSLGECARLRENVPYVKVHRSNPKHLYPKLNG